MPARYSNQAKKIGREGGGEGERCLNLERSVWGVMAAWAMESRWDVSTVAADWLCKGEDEGSGAEMRDREAARQRNMSEETDMFHHTGGKA